MRANSCRCSAIWFVLIACHAFGLIYLFISGRRHFFVHGSTRSLFKGNLLPRTNPLASPRVHTPVDVPPPPFPPTQVVERLRERVASVVDKDHRGYSNSSYVGIDPNAYDVWKSRDFWVVPWLREAVEKEESVAGGGSIVGAAGSGVVGAGNT